MIDVADSVPELRLASVILAPNCSPRVSIASRARRANARSAPGIIPYIVQHELPEGGNEFTLAPGGFHASFCADIPAEDAAFYAITQRPLAGVALTEAAPTPAWRSRPVWAVLPTADRCIDPGVHRFSYERMGATVTEIEGASHVVMISHPKEVAEVVMTAIRACAVQPT